MFGSALKFYLLTVLLSLVFAFAKAVVAATTLILLELIYGYCFDAILLPADIAGGSGKL